MLPEIIYHTEVILGKRKMNKSGYVPYLNALQHWVDWSDDRKLRSVLTYLSKGCMIKDLLESMVFFANNKGQLIETLG